MQGDLPTLAPADLAAALAPLTDSSVDIGTLAAEIKIDEERTNPNVVKVVGTPVHGKAPAARSISPAPRRPRAKARSTTISGSTLIAAPRCNASSACLPPRWNMRERLEQLRALEAGMRIDVAIVDSVPLGVDTPEDLARARDILASGS